MDDENGMLLTNCILSLPTTEMHTSVILVSFY